MARRRSTETLRCAPRKTLPSSRPGSFYESVIAMRQIDHQVVRLALYAVNDHQSFTEVGLGIARRMHQRPRTSLARRASCREHSP